MEADPSRYTRPRAKSKLQRRKEAEEVEDAGASDETVVPNPNGADTGAGELERIEAHRAEDDLSVLSDSGDGEVVVAIPPILVKGKHSDSEGRHIVAQCKVKFQQAEHSLKKCKEDEEAAKARVIESERQVRKLKVLVESGQLRLTKKLDRAKKKSIALKATWDFKALKTQEAQSIVEQLRQRKNKNLRTHELWFSDNHDGSQWQGGRTKRPFSEIETFALLEGHDRHRGEKWKWRCILDDKNFGPVLVKRSTVRYASNVASVL
jgi:hypothetical protein